MTKAEKPKVFAFMPSLDEPKSSAMLHAMAALGYSRSQGDIDPTNLVNRRYAGTAIARNWAAIQAIETGCSHVWYVDDDTVVPKDALSRLLALDADIATGCTPFWQSRQTGVVVNVQREEGAFLKPWPYGTFECVAAGTSCMLIRTEVFEKLRDDDEPWFNYHVCNRTGLSTTEDIIFCQRARAAGFNIWCDAAVACGHLKNIDIKLLCPPVPMSAEKVLQLVGVGA